MLATFAVASNLSATDYVVRVRAVLSAAIQAADEIESGSGSLPEEIVPSWFAEATRGPDVIGYDDAAALGRQRYIADRDEQPWNLQDWLFCFDPDLRGWAWWDVTQVSSESVIVWVDSSGEPVFPCEELRWLIYASGAKSVEGPILRPISEWRQAR